jgi:hypothetical protein
MQERQFSAATPSASACLCSCVGPFTCLPLLPLMLLLLLQGAIPWDPHTLERAMGGGRGEAEMTVLDCADFSTVSVTHNDFFTG